MIFYFSSYYKTLHTTVQNNSKNKYETKLQNGLLVIEKSISNKVQCKSKTNKQRVIYTTVDRREWETIQQIAKESNDTKKYTENQKKYRVINDSCREKNGV